MKKQQSSRNSFVLGEQRQKAFTRTELAKWDPARRTRKTLDVLHDAMADRLPALVQLKNQRMATSPFVFFRGAAAVMGLDLSLTENTGIVTQLCGDAHVQNLGAYTGPDGRLIFDVNDFDETMRGPFEWDVKRMVTSILLAGREAEIKKSGRASAAETFLSSYSELLQRLSRLPVLEAARYQVHCLASVQPISKILSKAERATPMHSLEQLTEKGKHGRVFKSQPPLLRRLAEAEAKAVLSSLPRYASSLLPERQHFFAQFRPLDVAFKVVGTGSIGLRDYCVYMEGNGSRDPLFLQIKQEARSVYAEYLPEPEPHSYANQGHRVVDGQRAMQLQSDPLLGWTELEGRDYLVRQLNDHKASVDVATLKAASLVEYAEVCGEMLARGHARSGDAPMIAGYLGNGKQFAGAMMKFGSAYADQTTSDWEEFVRQKNPG